MKKFVHFILLGLALLTLVACAPKRYQRKNSPKVDQVESTQSSERNTEEASKTEEGQEDLDKIGTLTGADEADIRSVIDNGYSLFFSKLVKPINLVQLNSDHISVDAYRPAELIDYYNTYKEGTYNLEDVIRELNATEITSPVRSLSESELSQLAKEYQNSWVYSTQDKAFYEFVAYGRGGAAPPLEIPSASEWVVGEDTVEVTTRIQGSGQPLFRYVLKRNNKEYKGGERHTRFYVVSRENAN